MGTLIIHANRSGKLIADRIKEHLLESEMIALDKFEAAMFHAYKQLVFVGALGICVRTICCLLEDKHVDPGVVCVDSTGKFAISVASGHIGGANALCRQIANIIGAQAVVTTQSDNEGLWSLDMLAQQYDMREEIQGGSMNKIVATFVNRGRTALCIESCGGNLGRLYESKPEFVDFYHRFDEINREDYDLVIAVTPKHYKTSNTELILWLRPKVLHLGFGCKKNCGIEGIVDYIRNDMECNGYSPLSLKSISTIELKRDEEVLNEFIHIIPGLNLAIYNTSELEGIEILNPSEKVKEVTGVAGVAECCAIKAASGGKLVIEKQKCHLSDDRIFTYAVALDLSAESKGHIEIVGAGPGDPELISVKGKRFLQQADLILYAGSLVPKELTFYARNDCRIESSASMTLEEQFLLMKEFYDKNKLVVRLHTGDPCIYGAIQEQMAFFDKYGMDYHITPGISSFLAAAAELKSQFTIPEKVQSIILTRGEGKTPMPEKERLSELAKSQSTMCIFLSADIVESIEEQLLTHYPASTPVAVCYKLTWKDQKIFRGELKDLSRLVRDNGLKLTTLLVVGDAIDNREGLSKLYDNNFSHLFREANNKM